MTSQRSFVVAEAPVSCTGGPGLDRSESFVSSSRSRSGSSSSHRAAAATTTAAAAATEQQQQPPQFATFFNQLTLELYDDICADLGSLLAAGSASCAPAPQHDMSRAPRVPISLKKDL
jgi:hypothetical protein